MKLITLPLALLALAPLTASAITINIVADVLKQAPGDGSPMPVTGVVVLTTATDGILSGPYGSSFVSGSEVVLGRWDLSIPPNAGDPDGDPGTAGLFMGELNLSFLDFAGWDAGDPLQLYWYPSLSLAAAGPAAGINFGYYSDPLGVDGSDPWRTTADDSILTLNFFTADSIAAGSNGTDAGFAAHLVPPTSSAVPDAGGTLVLLSLSLAGMTAVRRFHPRRRGQVKSA